MFTKEQIQNYPELLEYYQEHSCGIHFHTRMFFPSNPYEDVKIVLKQAILNREMGGAFKRFIKDFSSFQGSLIENIKVIDPNMSFAGRSEDLGNFVHNLLYESYINSVNDGVFSEFIEYVFGFKEFAKKTIQEHLVNTNFFHFIFNETFPFLTFTDEDLSLYCKSDLTWSEMFSTWKSFFIWRLKYVLPYRPDSHYLLQEFSFKYPKKFRALDKLILNGYNIPHSRLEFPDNVLILAVFFGFLNLCNLSIQKYTQIMISLTVLRLFFPYLLHILVKNYYKR